MISVIIPAYNEERALPLTLQALLEQAGNYEVWVVDGGSTDRTRDIVRGFEVRSSTFRVEPMKSEPPTSNLDPRTGCVRLLTAPKGRASQMNAGAARARGDWLLFLHADTQLPEGALARLNTLEDDGSVQAGGFLHRFSGNDWRLRMISFLDNFRCTRSLIIYGDQALFVRPSLFAELGGFPSQPILEDVAFCERLLRVTTPILLTSPVVTDSRKFVRMGIWRSFVRVLLIILHVEFRLPVLPRAFFRDIR
jgi:rSAM/selenodomain-associated transferase 2